MNCKETRKWMSPYLDSELGATKTFEVGAHLSDCPGCKSRFESERKVDDLVRSRLQKDVMPPEMWERISRTVSEPRWVRQLRSPRTLALAACLAMAVLGTVLIRSRPSGGETPEFVQSLLVAAPDNVPFADADMDRIDIMHLLDDRFDGKFTLAVADEHMDRHRLEFIEAVDRTDENGRAYVELRLNCCGRPVLMALARRGADELPSVFSNAPLNGATSAIEIDGVHLATKNFGGIIAVVASRHPVEQIASGLKYSKA
ncbi:MAG: anti-sigma factor family protein [Phycisphaerae bacterium]